MLHVAKLSLESDTSAGENRTILIFKLMKGRCDPSENIYVVVFTEFQGQTSFVPGASVQFVNKEKSNQSPSNLFNQKLF